MANLGCIEINPWHSRTGRLDNPDYMVLDLDPLDIPFVEVVRVARITHDVLVEIGATGFCKTSGATGLHVYVPLGARYSHDQTVQFARLVNLLVRSRLPRTTSIERDPEKRKGKVYLDFLQNGYGQTLVAPYCLRPRKGAPVSTPLAWDEVAELPRSRPLHHRDDDGAAFEKGRSMERRAGSGHRYGASLKPPGRKDAPLEQERRVLFFLHGACAGHPRPVLAA